MQFEGLVADNKKKADEVKGMMDFITGEISDYKKDPELQVAPKSAFLHFPKTGRTGGENA